MEKKIIYFDNAATSWPKPPEVADAMTGYLNNVGGSPGRSAHRLSIEAGRILFDTREKLAALLNIEESLNLVFTQNATAALNLAIHGLLKPGDHVLVSPWEHNAVMRPLRWLEKKGLEITRLPAGSQGAPEPEDIIKAVKKNTRAAFFTHGSNVTGTLQPVGEIAPLLREWEVLICVDGAQTCGACPIDISAWDIDLFALTGHKSLLGPQGTGALYIRPGLEKVIEPLVQGGTGSLSEEEEQPTFMPDRYESGTPNTVGLAGLGAAIDFISQRGVEEIRRHEMSLTEKFIDGIKENRKVTLHGTETSAHRTSAVSFSIEGVSASEAALFFDEEYNIMSRPGLHCAPSAHQAAGTHPAGTNRFSFGIYNTEEEINTALEAIEKLSRSKK